MSELTACLGPLGRANHLGRSVKVNVIAPQAFEDLAQGRNARGAVVFE